MYSKSTCNLLDVRRIPSGKLDLKSVWFFEDATRSVSDLPGWWWTIIRWIWGWAKFKKGMPGTNCLFRCNTSCLSIDPFTLMLLLSLTFLCKLFFVGLFFSDFSWWFSCLIHLASFRLASVQWKKINTTKTRWNKNSVFIFWSISFPWT